MCLKCLDFCSFLCALPFHQLVSCFGFLTVTTRTYPEYPKTPQPSPQNWCEQQKMEAGQISYIMGEVLHFSLVGIIKLYNDEKSGFPPAAAARAAKQLHCDTGAPVRYQGAVLERPAASQWHRMKERTSATGQYTQQLSSPALERTWKFAKGCGVSGQGRAR